MKSVPSYSSPSAILGIAAAPRNATAAPRATAMDGGSTANAGGNLRPAVRENVLPALLGAQDVDQALRLAALVRVALIENLLEDAARTFGVAHVDVGTRQVELRADLGHRLRVEAHF